MRAVVANQHLGTGFIHHFDQLFAFGHRGGDGLFQQDGNLGRDALQRLRHMQRVGRGQDQPVGAAFVQQLINRSVQRHTGLGRQVYGGWRRINDGGQRTGRTVQRHAHVGLADVAGAGHCDADFVHGEKEV